MVERPGILGSAPARMREPGCSSGLGAWPSVEDLEKVVSFAQVVRQLDHLETQWSGAQAPRGEHDEGLDDHPSPRPMQCSPRNHSHLENALVRWSIGAAERLGPRRG
jgi:hypothetical protein